MSDDHPPPASSLSLSFVANPKGDEILITVAPPELPASLDQESVKDAVPRAPLNLVLLIDTSEAMAVGPPVFGNTVMIFQRPTWLDWARHAAVGIIMMLGDSDQLSIVTFNGKAKVQLPPSPMIAQNKQRALALMTTIKDIKGSHQLWPGLKSAMDVVTQSGELTGANQRIFAPRVSSIFILSTFPRSFEHTHTKTIASLRTYVDTHSPFTINAFGLGPNPDARLLHEVTKLGHGVFELAPSADDLYDALSHALANALATYADSLRIELKVDGPRGARNAVLAGSERPLGEESSLALGVLQYGQTKDIVVKLPMPISSTMSLNVNVQYRPWSSPEPVKITRVAGTSLLQTLTSDMLDPRLAFHVHRLKMTAICASFFKPSDASGPPPNLWLLRKDLGGTDLEVRFKDLASRIRQAVGDEDIVACDTPESDLLDLLAEVEGRLAEAVKTDQTFLSWGHHHLCSLARAHREQQRGNSRSQSIQLYSRDSEAFETHLNATRNAFDRLGEPKTRAIEYGGSPARGIPCFAGSCLVELADGREIPVASVRRGMTVKTLTGAAKVVTILRTLVQGGLLDMCSFDEGLLITPWHPIQPEQDLPWVFPADERPPRLTSCDAIFSLMLQENHNPDAHTVFVGGICCTTLGHGLCSGQEDVRTHPFLGNRALIVKELLQLPDGSIEGVKEAKGVKRHFESGLMNGFEG